MEYKTKKPRKLSVYKALGLAGMAGFEPTNARVKEQPTISYPTLLIVI